ncbi:hypothetical protein HEP85_01605 [Streptomyces sp. RPA4-2]|uniref:hypothetical protein n=1 Tax=Streptomyces sp. RPA4-2 TaxID=2721244 RepID=UPI00143E848A|nr:hypothetical protein [Streptomyces sp. RPA4-2]QIY60625.1 hypothetical protein HEP85_01605 [Streptomyces sp. RPA4-2]
MASPRAASRTGDLTIELELCSRRFLGLGTVDRQADEDDPGGHAEALPAEALGPGLMKRYRSVSRLEPHAM